ncbi:molybdate ABC transporter substrate-binding protein [Thermoleptolyngbya sichuanensis A183]|uniref:Molybdate ABC transporter substrate-binding protein n=1 Tax=Thermoleptolyngbya sichuanensis A183 TaxID=2737172 RepID=A0A6M8BJF6_9CYAN|nr:molybdate ABC transporter substrate-binding protein [Thermoleptolyngbya sichuanensis A183]
MVRKRVRRQNWFLRWAWVGLLVGLLGSCNVASNVAPESALPVAQELVTLTVSAAADLNYVFPEIGKQWEAETGHRVTFNLGSTGQLAQQIERGAPVDLFAAANRKFIEDLDEKGLIRSETKTLYGVGRILLWQRADSPLDLKTLQDLTKPEVTRVAIANPDHAPYGVAAREAMQSAGIWDAIQPKLVFGENIKQTQQYAETGNVEVAIAALSISVGKPGKWTLIPAELHQPLEQMLAVPKSAPHPELAQQFAAFINGEKGRPLMRKYGFVLPGEELVL